MRTGGREIRDAASRPRGAGTGAAGNRRSAREGKLERDPKGFSLAQLARPHPTCSRCSDTGRILIIEKGGAFVSRACPEPVHEGGE